MEDPQFFIGQEEEKRKFESHRPSTHTQHALTYQKPSGLSQQVRIAVGVPYALQSVWRVSSCRQVMTRRSPRHFSDSIIMPIRFYLSSSVLFCTGLLILTVMADLKGQPDLTQVTANSDSIKEDVEKEPAAAAAAPVLCECEFFVQSWKTSHMIRLPMGIQPVRANTTTQTSDSDLCILLCQNQLPPLPEDEKESKWARIFKGACRTLLANELTSRHGLARMTNALGPSTTGSDDEEPVRGCLQAFARSAHTRIWVPMGLQYRKLLSCSHPRHRRSLTEGRKVSNSKSSFNSVDAQSAVDAVVVEADQPSVSAAATAQTDQSSTAKPYVSPLRLLLKRMDIFGPVTESLVDVFDNGAWRELLSTFALDSYVDRYQRIAVDYPQEIDIGHCYFEYFTYNVFNNRFARKSGSSRGMEDDAVGFLVNAATGFLRSDNASQILTSLFSRIPSSGNSKRVERQEEAAEQKAPPNPQEVAMSIARFYLRHYFSSLTGSKVQLNKEDPTNNPESIADMIEQVSKPVFLSVFGVVPGAPASGNLGHLLTLSSSEVAEVAEVAEVTEDLANNDIGMRPPEFRNKLVPTGPTRASDGLIESIPTLGTGNSFFDFGNSFVATFQRASDATHGLYCAKQYAVNKVWKFFSGFMRKMMRDIPKAG